VEGCRSFCPWVAVADKLLQCLVKAKRGKALGDGAITQIGQTAARLTRRAMPLAGCWGSTYEWNQKLTLVVQTPNGDVTASSVIRASYTYGQMPMSGNDMSGGYTGEAVVMKLGTGKYLFALLNADGTDEYHRILKTFADELPDDREGGFATITKLRGARPVAANPMLVTFGNINDPKSVKQVWPNSFAAIFGAGYALKSITLEVTDEPVTEGVVEGVLGWLKTRQFQENPTWASLDNLTQKAISGLQKKPRN
jgi:hypothetical protein